MFSIYSDPNVLVMIEKQRRNIEMFSRVAPRFDTPLIDNIKALLDASPDRETPEVESLCAQLRNRLDGGR